MSDGYSRSPKLLKGAIVQFTDALVIPIPNIIVFQYNPDSLSRTMSPFQPAAPPAASGAPQQNAVPAPSSTAQPYDPAESFTVSLFLDATDALEEPDSHPVAFIAGVADRMAALEMLLYPSNASSPLGNLVGSIAGALGGASAASKFKPVGAPEVPVTLFIWGPGRIVPVRLTTFTVEEQNWNQLLYPTRAKVSVGMKVLTSTQIKADNPSSTSAKGIAAFCYDWTIGQKQVLALANLANSVESILGMLPF